MERWRNPGPRFPHCVTLHAGYEPCASDCQLVPASRGGACTAWRTTDRAAMATGGKDNGAPGLRPHYHPNYYGAFVLDPDGHNIEAVCHSPA